MNQLPLVPWDQSSYLPSEPNSLRSSVIVGSSSTSLSTEFNEIFKQEESGEEIDIGSSVVLEDLNLQLEGPSDIQAICLTYLAEDVPYMEERKRVFMNAWYEINIGENLVANWIAFARDGLPLPRDFHAMAHGQLSERYINCTCSLDLIEKVSQESLLRVLRERLPLVDALDKIIIFNYEAFSSCADIVLSHDDLKQWKEETGSAVPWPPHQRMLSGMPGTPEMKLELFEFLRSNCNSLFTDRVVHMLVVALTIFSADDVDKNVRDVHTVAESMLRTICPRRRRL